MSFKEGLVFATKGDIIRNFVKKKKLIIYGGQSIRKHIGWFSRDTIDYDIVATKPETKARHLKAEFDKRVGHPHAFFVKPAIHPGTYKLKHVGQDRRKNTEDDLEVADFSKPSRKLRTQTIDGIKYSHLSESIKDKRTSLADPMFAFRHPKDRDDLNRMLTYKKHKKTMRRY